MPTIDDLLPVVPNNSDETTSSPIPYTVTAPSVGGPGDAIYTPTQHTPSDQQWWDNFAQAPSSTTTQLDPVKFDWDKSGAERFVNSDHIRQLGFDPYLGSKEVDGKSYDLNELKYQQAQTWGDVLKSGMGQFAGLTWNSFKESAYSDRRFLNALFNPMSWSQYASGESTFGEKMLGSGEDLLEADKRQKAIMNTNPIFQSPATQGIFNKEFVGDSIGQLGFTVGTMAYMAAETLLTGGIMDGITTVSKARNLTRIGKAAETLNILGDAEMTVAQGAERTKKLSDAIIKMTESGDLAKNRPAMESIWNGMKKLVPGYEMGNDMRLAAKAGATFGQTMAAGLPGLIKSYTMFNAARSEAAMEAAGTYGEQYMGLLDSYEKKHGHPATGQDLQDIRDNAYGAATDNFIVNTGLLMTMNEIEFGGMMSKFSSSKRLLREAAEAAETAEGKAMYTITGKAARDIGESKVGETATKVYKANKFGAMGLFPTIRKDFGLGTALWQAAKQWGKGAGKFEISEGVQEILQNTSDTTLRDYYSTLYNGNKDIHGTQLFKMSSSDWGKGLAGQMNQEGWKTFLMGATTGLFLSPLSAMTMYGRHRGAMAVNQRYKDTYNAQKQIIDQNIDILNQFYSNTKTALNDHIAKSKVTTEALKNMKSVLPVDDKYTYYNSQDDILTKAAATAIKTGTISSMLDRIKSMGDGRLSDSELREALNLPDTGDNDPKHMLNEIVQGIESYYHRYSDLKDKYSDMVIPELETDPQKHYIAQIQKKALDESIEILATFGHKGADVLKRAAKIKSEMAAIPGIGSSVNRSFELMGNEKELSAEVKRLREMAANTKGLQDKEATELAKQAERQADALENWSKGYKMFQEMRNSSKEQYDTPGFTESYVALQDVLHDRFREYVEAHNEGLGKNINYISEQSIRKAFQSLGDYIALNRDAGQYIEALNVLTNPKTFTSLHQRIQDGLSHATEANKAEAEEEIKSRAKATAPEEEQTTTDDTTDTTSPEAPEEPTPDKEETTPEETTPTDTEGDKEGGEESTPEPVVEKEPTQKILRVRDQVRIHPLRDNSLWDTLRIVKNSADKYDVIDTANGDKLIGTKDTEQAAKDAIRRRIGDIAQLKLDNILRTISHDNLVDNISLVITPNTQYQSQGATYPFPGNDHIIQNRSPYTLEIRLGSDTIGFITAPGIYSYVFNGQHVDPQALTVEQFLEVFDMKNYEGKSPEALLKQWKQDNITSLALQNKINEAITASGGNIEVTSDILKGALDINVTSGTYAYENTKENRPTLQQLQDTGNSIVAIVDKNGLEYMGDSKGLPSVPENIQSHMRAAIRMPNGVVKWVEASPAAGGNVEENIAQMAEAIRAMNNVDTEDREKAADQVRNMAEKVFITLSPEHAIQKLDIKVGKDKSGDPILRLGYLTRDGKSGNLTMPAFSDMDSLVKVINSTVNKASALGKKGITVDITPDNIRMQTSTVYNADELMGMQVGVKPTVVENMSLVYSVKEGNLVADVAPTVPTEEPEWTIEVIEGTKGPIQGNGKTVQPAQTIPSVQPVATVQTPQATSKAQVLQQAANAGDTEDIKASIRKSRTPVSQEDDLPSVWKVMPTEQFTDNSVVNIDAFTSWGQRVLPESIRIEDLGNLDVNLKAQNITVGQFITSLRTIQVYRNAPAKYHEAFHAVFRLLLPQYKIDQLLEISKKENLVTQKKLDDYRKLHPTYASMSDAALTEVIAEEHMADKFDAWMSNKKTPTSHIIKGFFAKIADWIKELFSRLTGRRMQSLFYEINRGKYRKAHIQSNQFTDTNTQVSEPAMKVIQIGWYDKEARIPKVLPQQKGEQLACTVAAMYHQMYSNESQQNRGQLLDRILDMFKDMYNPDGHNEQSYLNKARTYTNKMEQATWWNNLYDIYDAFSIPAARTSFKEAVDTHLQIMGYKQNILEDEYEAEENRDGVRTTADYNKNADEFGGFSSLGRMLREYIGSTTRPYEDEFGNVAMTDEFGNSRFPNGQVLIEAVNAAHVYNGMLKVLSNSVDDVQLLNKLENYRDTGNNPETVAFINRILTETGFQRNEDGMFTVTKNPTLFQQMLKGFNQYSTNPQFVDIVPGGTVKVYSPSRQDSAKTQLDNWQQAFNNLYLSQYNQKERDQMTEKELEELLKKDPNALQKSKYKVVRDAKKPWTDLHNVITAGKAKDKLDEGKMFDEAQRISNVIKTTQGINLHPNYLIYVMVASKDKSVRTPYQEQIYRSNQDVYALDTDDIKGIQTALDGGDIFAKPEGTSAEDMKKGAAARLLKIAAANAQFDETVDSMTYTDPEGKVRYSSQEPNYYMIQTRELNNQRTREQLENSVDHDNWMLHDDQFQAMAAQRKLVTAMATGMKVREKIEIGEKNIAEEFSGGIEEAGQVASYKGFGERETQAYLLGLYGVTDNKVYDGDSRQTFYTSPHLLTVIEAKSTGLATNLPVQKAYGKKGITGDTLDKLYEMVQQEVARIKRVQDGIANGQEDITDYNNGTLRGLKLYNTKLWFSPEVREAIEQGAQNDPLYQLDEKAIKTLINSYWNKRIDSYIDYLSGLGLVKKHQGNGLENLLLPEFLDKGFDSDHRNNKMNLIPGNLRHNIAQVFMNDVVNTSALRQLMHGDEAKSFKDNIDRIKRAAGGNAAGKSVSFAYTAPDLGIYHEFTQFHHVTYNDPKFTKMDGTKGDKSDAQMYCTEKGLRYALFGFGKLDKVKADILTKVKNGDEITAKEVFGEGGLKERGAFNSMKVVYYDPNNVYLKCSMIPILREEVSYWANGEWHPKINTVEKHNLLNKLESYEERNNTVVYAGPKTHSKGLKQNVATTATQITDDHMEPLETKWFRLQMENPSNKTKITEPSQSSQQILSEQLRDTLVYYDGQHTTVGKVMDSYMNDIAQRNTNNYQSTVNSMFTIEHGMIALDRSIQAGQVTPELATFFQSMKESMEATGSDQQTLAMLEVQAGQPVYDLNFPATLTKYTQMFLSHFSKSMNEKYPGLTVALVSDWGHQKVKQVLSVYPEGHPEAGQPRTWRVVTDKEYKADPGRYAGAKRWVDVDTRTFGGLEVGDYIVDDLRHNVPEYDEDGNIIGRYTEYVRPAHWGEEMHGLVDALVHGFGVRIPSDDKHQYVALRMVDTLPVVLGSSAMFPQELMEISGADFDIDKLFIQLQDIYKKAGEIVAYGDNSTFDDYVRWTYANNRQFRTLYNGNTLYSWEEAAIELLSMGDINMVRAEAILKKMKLPSTQKEYNDLRAEGKEPNNGILNNRVLAAKIALLNNEAIAGGGKDAILNQATSTDPLKDLADRLQGQGLIEPEEDTEINSLHGKGIAYINNQEGKRNIGAAINSMLAFSLMEQKDIKLDKKDGLFYNGQDYYSFIEPTTTDGVRKFAQISAIVNAMTDNAKERLAARLGLNITAVGIVTTMVAMGMPMEDAVLYQLQPSVKEYYKRLKNRESILQNEGDDMSAKRILDGLIGKYEKMIAKGTDSPLDHEKLLQNIREKGQATPELQVRALKDIQQAQKIADTMRTISSVMKLGQGLDVSWEDMDNTMRQIQDLQDSEKSVIDGHAILHSHPIFDSYLKMFHQVRELAKTMFIERTPLFQQMQSQVRGSMDAFKTDDKWNKTMKEDLISYLSIKSYINWLKSRNSDSIKGMDHAMIYQSEKNKQAAGYEDITDIIKRLRGTTSNYLVNKFLNIVLHDQQGNKSKLNKAEGNSWARLSEQQQQKLYDSFVDLYTNEETHHDAEKLFNYLLVKDGGKFTSGSFIKYIPPFAFKDLMDRTKEITKAMVSGDVSDTTYQQLFGDSRENVMNGFLNSYVTNIGNMNYLMDVEDKMNMPKSKWSQSGNRIVKSKTMDDQSAPAAVKIGKQLYVNTDDNDQWAEYTPQPWRGSFGQWKGAGVFGEVPVMGGKNVPQNLQQSSDAQAAEEAMYVDNPGYSPEAPGQGVQEVAEETEMPRDDMQQLTGTPVLQQLNERGIFIYTDGRKGYYVNKDNRILEEYAGIKPSDLLQKLSNTMTSAQPVVPSQSTEAPSDKIGDMFTREELNSMFKERNDKKLTAAKWKEEVEKALTVPNITKEEITEAIKCL